MNQSAIPFNRPHLAGAELDLIEQAVLGLHTSGDGPFTRQASRLLESATGTARALLTTSCTHALEMSAVLLDLREGDEVILPSFTFVSTANAIVMRGATPVFVDIRPDTLNLDEQLVEAAITPRTRGLIAVHYAGVACEMDTLQAIAERNGLWLVEDNAHGLNGRYRGRPLGSFGELATLSFHETKNVHCGEGGALLVNDSALVERAEVLREKGTNRSQFFRGQVDKYTWVDVGSSWLLADLLAAYLVGQLEALDDIQARRHGIWDRYAHELRPWAADNGVSLPFVPEECDHPAHLFYVLMPTLEIRQAFIEHLAARGVQAVFHYVPLHSSPGGRRFGRSLDDCPITGDVSDRLVRLPLYAGLTEQECDRVVEAATEFECRL